MSNISYQIWGNHNHKPVYLFRMENTSGAYIELSNYGATVVAIYVADRNYTFGNVILGFPSLEGYLNDSCYLGSTIGRFANRIAGASFVLDNTKYTLDDNDSGNSNHGGKSGFNNEVFDFSIEGDSLSFTHLSKNGAGGFPGNLNFKVSYRWTENNELHIDYQAVTDQKTVVNFTNHAYFNLAADGGKIFDHELSIFSDLIASAGADYIPTGLFQSTGPLTFKNNKIREKLSMSNQQAIELNSCYLLDKNNINESICAAVLSDEKSGRVMEVYTTYPCLMLYTGDFLSSTIHGNHLKSHEPFDGVCLECQYLPDSPNHAHFPSTILNPGTTFQETISFKFSTTS